MKKTPIARRFIKQLNRANDQVCFAALQQREFLQHLAPLIDGNHTRFTSDVFPKNQFSDAINRKVDDLPDFSKEAEVVALQMGVIAAVEYVLAYIEEVQVFRESMVTNNGDPIRVDAKEEQLRLKIAQWRGSSPTAGYFWTLGYFRLLRNHFVHVNEAPSPKFNTYIQSYGTPLNSFWNNGVTDVHGIDFRILPLTVLTPDLAFGTMNLLRVCVRHVDEMIADSLSLTDVASQMVAEFRAVPRHRQMPVSRLSSKVATRLRMEWGIDESISTVQIQVENIISEMDCKGE